MITYRLEVWNRAGTERLAIVVSLESASRRVVLGGEEILEARVDASDPALELLSAGALLRLQRVGSDEASLWRFVEKSETLSEEGLRWTVITADAAWTDLRHGRVRQRLSSGRVQLSFALVGLTPEDYLDGFILPGYDGSDVAFELGDVEIFSALDLAFDHVSPLAAIRTLEEETGGEIEFELDADALTYTVHLRERIGSSTSPVEIRYGANLSSLERITQEEEVVTRLYAQGGGLLTIADARWRISFVNESIDRVYLNADPRFVGWDIAGLYFFVPGKGGAALLGWDPNDANSIDVAAGHGFAAADVGYFSRDELGELPLEYLQTESATDPAGYGVRPDSLVRDDIPDATNLIDNAFLSTWAGGLPQSWESVGSPQISESSSPLFAKWGARAARVESNQADEGIRTGQFFIPDGSTLERPYTSARAGLTLISGAVRMEIQGPGGEVYPLEERPRSIAVGSYNELEIENAAETPLPSGWYRLAFLSHGAAAEWYLDFGMVTLTIGASVPAPVEESGAVELWAAAARELAERSRPKLEYRVSAIDLYRLDPSLYSRDRFRIGDSITVRDPVLGVAALRIVELVEDLTLVDRAELVVAEDRATRASGGVGLYLPKATPHRPGQGEASFNPAVAGVESHDLEELNDLVTISAVGRPATTSLELYTKTDPDAEWPALPTQTLAARSGTFTPISLSTERFYYLIQAFDSSGAPGGSVQGSIVRDSTPNVEPVVEYDENGTLAYVSLYVRPRLGSQVNQEAVTLRLRMRDPFGFVTSPILQLVEDAAATEPRYMVMHEGANAGAWWRDDVAGTNSQALSGIVLQRDRIQNIYIQAVTESGLEGPWIAVPLTQRAQPWAEAVSLKWNESTGELISTVTGGAFAQSIFTEFDTVETFDSADYAASSDNIVDGQTLAVAHPLDSDDRGQTWFVRRRLFSKPLLGGAIDYTGIASAYMIDREAVPSTEPTVITSINAEDYVAGNCASLTPLENRIVVTFSAGWTPADELTLIRIENGSTQTAIETDVPLSAASMGFFDSIGVEDNPGVGTPTSVVYRGILSRAGATIDDVRDAPALSQDWTTCP